jgi:hypothetical protein
MIAPNGLTMFAMTDADPKRCLVWHSAAQFDLVHEVAALAGLEVVAAGTPERGRSVAGLWGEDVGAPDDLRAAIASADGIDLVLLADPGGFGEDPADAAAVESLMRRGARVLSFEPIPPSAASISGGWGVSLDGTPLYALVGFAGYARATPVFREAFEALEQFGLVTAFAANCTAGPAAGSLGARLLSVMELVHPIAGEPEFINASLAQPRETRPGRNDRLHELRGTMTANIRFADHRAATILVSAATEPWHRGITILGEGGRMRIWDDGFRWTAPDGSTVDEHRAEAAPAGNPAARHLAASVEAVFQTAPPRIYATSVLAMAEAALLSTRTGSAESPEMLRRVAENP